MDLCAAKDLGIENIVATVDATVFCKDGWNSEDNKLGNCCCNCVWQQPITGHPWNKNPEFKGSVANAIGFGCCAPDLYPYITFFETAHGMCECHSRKK